MSCQILEGLLALSPEISVEEVDRHMLECAVCRPEFAATDKKIDAWLRGHSPDHLTTERIVEIAEGTALIASEQSSAWRHILQCRDCYEEVARVRQAFRQRLPLETEASMPSAAEAWSLWQVKSAAVKASQSQIVAAWTGALLVYVSHRGMSRGALRVRRASKEGPAIPEIQETSFVLKFHPYSLSIEISPWSDPASRSWVVHATLEADEGSSLSGIRLALRYNGEDHSMRAFGPSGRIELPPEEGVGNYELVLSRGADEILGVVEIKIEARG